MLADQPLDAADTPSAAGGPACRACGGTDLEPIELREMLFGTRERFGYLRCLTCGLLQIRRVPADLGRYYPPDYYPAGALPERRRLQGLARLAEDARNGFVLFGRGRWISRALRPWRPPVQRELRAEVPFVRRTGLRSFDDPILDVGCGRVPARLGRLRRLGFRALTGVDPWLEGDAEVDGIRLLRRPIGEAPGRYQVVMLHHAFEHVPDPAETLAAAARLIRPGGTIVIRMPVMGSWFWESYGTDWWELDPPRHLFVHTRRSLELLAAPAGLEIADIVFDSTFVEIIASEQIRRDIPWRAPDSWANRPSAGFDDATIEGFSQTVERLNREGTAGRAAFYLRAASPPAAGSR